MTDNAPEIPTRFALGDAIVDGDTLSVEGVNGKVSLEPRAFRVLRYFAERPGKLVTIDELMTAHWDGAVVEPNAVTRVIAQIRKALGDDARNSRYIETVARSGYRLVAPVGAGESTPAGGRTRPWIAAISVGLLLVAGIAFWPPPERVPSVAVYPFANLTGDEDLDYIGDGLAEEVISALSDVPAFEVSARSVSFEFPGSGKNALDFARTLEVAYFVDGSVRREGETLRLTTRLVDARTGQQTWSLTGDYDLSALFEAQDAVSGELVSAFASETNIDAPIPAGRAVRVPAPEAYELYLRGRRIWHRRGKEPLEPAVSFFAEAVRLDPDFARGWAALASAYVTWPSYSPKGRSTWAEAETVAARAIELDPTLAEPYSVLGTFAEYRREWRRANELFHEAVQRNPRSATAHFWLSEHLLSIGYMNESFRHLGIARDLDPTYVAPKLDAAWAHMLFGDPAEAERQFASAWREGVGSVETWIGRYSALLAAGDVDAADAWLEEAPLSSDLLTLQRRFLGALRDELEAPGFVDALVADNSIDHRHVVLLTAMLGRFDRTFEFVQRRHSDNLWVDGLILWGPGTELRLQPGYGEMLNDRGLVGFWEEFGWGDICRRSRDSIVCDARDVDLTLLPSAY